MRNIHFGAILLVIMLLLTRVTLAEPLKLWESNVTNAFWRDHPDIPHEDVWHDPNKDELAQFMALQPDVTTLNLSNSDFQAYMDADVLADLSGNAAIVEAVSRMPAWIQKCVTTADGRILALPTKVYIRPFYWYQDAWDAAGLTEADVPQSYTELLDFLDRWILRIRQQSEKNICVSRLVRWNSETEKSNYTYWLIRLLLLTHEMQQRYAGQDVSFYTPDFIVLAHRAREIGLALYEAEPRQAARQHMLQLFQSDISGGEHANGGRPYGLSHTVPLRLTRDQPALTSVDLTVSFVRKGSFWAQEGERILEHLLHQPSWFAQYALWADFEAGDYRFDNGTSAHVDAGWLADYHGYEGDFVYSPISYRRSLDSLNAQEALMSKFFKGSITAEEFAKGLDDIIQ